MECDKQHKRQTAVHTYHGIYIHQFTIADLQYTTSSDVIDKLWNAQIIISLYKNINAFIDVTQH